MRIVVWGKHISRRDLLRPVCPVIIALGMVYLSWIYSQYVCWNEIYKHHSKATGIGLIAGNCLFITILYFIWIQIFLIGPGIQPKLPVFKLIKDERTDYKSIEPPDYFISDINGYPIWCSTCQSIKANRGHHSSDINRCIARFDHFCSFLGLPIGKRNYRLFIQFMFWYFCYFIYIGVSSAISMNKIKERNGSINGNVIFMFIMIVFWMLMIFGLYATHIKYIYANISSIDDILNKRHRKNKTVYDQFMNFKLYDRRYILRINPNKDLIWDKGFINNWNELMGSNPVFWLLPWKSNIKNVGDESNETYETILGDYNEIMSEKWIKILIQRIENNEYVNQQSF